MRDSDNLYQVGSGQDGKNEAFLMYFEGRDDIIYWQVGYKRTRGIKEVSRLNVSNQKDGVTIIEIRKTIRV